VHYLSAAPRICQTFSIIPTFEHMHHKMALLPPSHQVNKNLIWWSLFIYLLYYPNMLH